MHVAAVPTYSAVLGYKYIWVKFGGWPDFGLFKVAMHETSDIFLLYNNLFKYQVLTKVHTF